MLKQAHPASIQRLIGLWSVATFALVVYFLIVSIWAVTNLEHRKQTLHEAEQNQLYVRELQLMVERQRARLSLAAAHGDLSETFEQPDYEVVVERLRKSLSPADSTSLEAQLKAEFARLESLYGRAQAGRLAEVRELLRLEPDARVLDDHLEDLRGGFRVLGDANAKSFEPLLFLFLGFGMMLALAIGWRVSAELNARLVPLTECSQIASRMGEGDFSVSLPPIRYRDEVGAVTVAMSGCFRRLRDVSRKGQILALEISSLANRALETSRHQAAAVKVESEIAQEAADGVDDLARGAGEVIVRSHEVIQRARVTEASTRSGLQAVQDTVRSVGTTLEQLQAVGDIAVALSENTRIIGDVVSMINDISDRSNIVAINASILAAASGMEAKSFAVVAREMKTLADQSKDASAGVRGILKNIERGIQTCAHLTEEAVNQGKSTGASTDDSDVTIRRLAENIKNSLQSFQETVNATLAQQESCSKVAQSLARLQSSCADSLRGANDLEGVADELHKAASKLVTLMSHYKQSPDLDAHR